MNDGQFMALRGLGQETNSLLAQLLGEQKRTNKLLEELVEPVTQEQRAAIFADVTPKPAHTPGRIYTEVQKQTTAKKVK